MKLSELLEFSEIVIQCHDNPDADAIASGFALYTYFLEKGKKVSLVYSGRNIIRKSNLVMMVDELDIPINYTKAIKNPELLITVDCQYGEGNVTKHKAQNVAVIDHHKVLGALPKLHEVRDTLGACSTLVWQMLRDEGIDINSNEALATALYYGLYADTNSFTEISHPLDRDLRDMAKFDKNLVNRLRNANMSLEELEIAGTALLRSDFIEDQRFAIVKAGECDPNVLGIISDLVLGVDAIDVCLVFNVSELGVKLSVRSCVKEVKANELAEEICRGIGSGGGHLTKAGGFVQMELLIPEYLNFCEKQGFSPRMRYNVNGTQQYPTDSAIKSLLEKRMVDYFADTEIIYSNTYDIKDGDMTKYIKKPLPICYVDATDIASEGTLVTVRTYSGDIDAEIRGGLRFVIDRNGNVELNTDSRFSDKYRIYPGWKFDAMDAEYKPTIKINDRDGRVISLLELSTVCIPANKKEVLGKMLDHKVKVFSQWDESAYITGKAGDMLIAHGRKPYNLETLSREQFLEEYRQARKNDDMNEYEAVIFDLDGTLLDTLEDLKNAVNAALKACDMPLCTLEQVRQYVGNGVRNLMIRAVPQGQDNPGFEKAFEEFKKYYALHCNDNTKPYYGIEFLMEELAARGIKIAIVSNKIDSAVKELNQLYFKKYVSTAIGEMEGIKRKPAPDTVNKALKELGVKASRAVYVGDSDVDIMTARNAGMKCISVTWGFRDEEFLKEHGATEMIERPIELLSLI